MPTRPDAHSLHAPYVKLIPIMDDDSNTMDIDEVTEIKPQVCKAPEKIKDPTIVCFYPS
jgi:hypothetical protein